MNQIEKLLLLISIVGITSCKSVSENQYQITRNYIPDDAMLFNTIVHHDSVFFNAYNTCDVNLNTYAAYFSEDIEFYHDQGGLMTNKEDIIKATEKNVCGKVTRKLVKGSIEVYPIKNYGAVEIGLHSFHNNTQPAGTPSKVGRFTIIWKNENNNWKITRVVSLH
ncbi:MAG TPA: nuclear transport factor 2 family protein [Chitinophagaceae bacterium]